MNTEEGRAGSSAERRSRTRPVVGWVYRGVALVVCMTMGLLVRRDWRGATHLPLEGGYITAVNHLSLLDPFAYGHFQYRNGHPPRFFVKSSLFDVPVLGGILRATRQIKVERESVRAADSLRYALDAVRAGECVALYPEGTITRDPSLWPGGAKSGVARLALMSGAPVVPVAQWGAHLVVPPYGRGGTRVRLWPRQTVVVAAGPPVDLSDLMTADPTVQVLREATERIMGAITVLLEDIRGERSPRHGS